jgi:hypothetical protein
LRPQQRTAQRERRHHQREIQGRNHFERLGLDREWAAREHVSSPHREPDDRQSDCDENQIISYEPHRRVAAEAPCHSSDVYLRNRETERDDGQHKHDDVNAPRARVWPWLVQLGQGRGGFYSYELLENLVGCDIHNVTQIRSELQHLHVGDTIRTHASGFGPPVSIIDPERALVLGGSADASGSQATWSFYVFDGPGGTTRLLERGRGAPGKGLLARLGFGPYLMDPIGFVMSRKMLRTIKPLAEGNVTGVRQAT